jgi:hypothetical protein
MFLGVYESNPSWKVTVAERSDAFLAQSQEAKRKDVGTWY